MGITHIMYVREDALRVEPDEMDKLNKVVGEAVTRLCLSPEVHWDPRRQFRVRKAAQILSHGNGVELVDEVESVDEAAYLWIGNCLRNIRELDDQDLQRSRDLVDAEIKRRMNEVARS